ncbi:hypothetical protein SMACR_06087 [Sordaria macrospora]|uniref:Infection structure specific protein n=1 Tax=Sordaria macrospora TaxID=5147 RepID=A0A8S8ZRX0_SORMA|nr:hypothetical protein SMACR_06087 [Sordaria macrospora]KAH7628175.1 hypothetical protein B0T09DRAFT_346045 [Sordaria sp. MPI-SDFR-AT-0083]WPJ65630.1 hypothetical protein SMAC4_06087 [Sordaria macrospora]
MRSNTLLVALAATASASAVPQPRAEAPAALITPGPIFRPGDSPVNDAIRHHGQQHGVNKRAYMVSMEISGKGSDFTKCVNSINSVMSSITSAAPYPSDADLASWLLNNVEEEPITTIPIDQAEKACETSDRTTATPPASLASAYSSYEKEAMSWQSNAAKGASSAVGNCPTKVREFVELTFVTDTAECKALVSKLNGKSGAASSSAPVLAAVAAFAGLVGVFAL